MSEPADIGRLYPLAWTDGQDFCDCGQPTGWTTASGVLVCPGCFGGSGFVPPDSWPDE